MLLTTRRSDIKQRFLTPLVGGVLIAVFALHAANDVQAQTVPTVVLELPADLRTSEAGSINVPITISGTVTTAITINVRTRDVTANSNPAAVAAVDYIGINAEITIPRDATTVRSPNITIVPDNILEEFDTFVVEFSFDPSENPDVGVDVVFASNRTSVLVTIIDDDLLTIGFAAPIPSSIFKGQTVELAVEALAGGLEIDITVSLIFGGSASLNTDYTLPDGSQELEFSATANKFNVNIPILSPAESEPAKTLTIDLQTMHSSFTDGRLTLLPGSISITIFDELVLTLEAVGNVDLIEGDDGVFRIEANVPVSADLTISYTVAGTAIAGEDYTNPSGQATIMAGEQSVDVTLPILTDSTTEDAETLIITLATSSDYAVDTNASSVTFTIFPVIVSFAKSGYMFDENSLVAVVKVTREGERTEAFNVRVVGDQSKTPNAVISADPVDEIITFRGNGEQEVMVRLNDDNVALETIEILELRIEPITGDSPTPLSFVGGFNNSLSRTIVRVQDDDDVDVAFRSAGVTIDEAAGQAMMCVVKDSITAVSLTVILRAVDSRDFIQSRGDFSEFPEKVTISAASLVQCFTVDTTINETVIVNESRAGTFDLVISDFECTTCPPGKVVIVDPTSVTITVRDDDEIRAIADLDTIVQEGEVSLTSAGIRPEDRGGLTYQWRADPDLGVFADASSANTTWSASHVSTDTTVMLSLTVMDTAGFASMGTVTITLQPIVLGLPAELNVSEAGTIAVPITISDTVTTTITVSMQTIDVTANSDPNDTLAVDYMAMNRDFMISSGATGALSPAVTIVSDTALEGFDTFIIELSVDSIENPGVVFAGNRSTVLVTIMDDDNATIGFAGPIQSSFLEGEIVEFVVEVLNGSLGADIPVSLIFGGSASSVSDYTLPDPRVLDFGATATQFNISIQILSSNESEPVETLTIALQTMHLSFTEGRLTLTDPISITIFDEQLMAPVIIAAEPSRNSVTLSWEAVTDATSYVVSITNEDDTPVISPAPMITLVGEFAEITLLALATTYTVSVVAIADGFHNSVAATTEVVTLATIPDEIPPQIIAINNVPSIEAIAVGATSLMLRWIAATDQSGILQDRTADCAQPDPWPNNCTTEGIEYRITINDVTGDIANALFTTMQTFVLRPADPNEYTIAGNGTITFQFTRDHIVLVPQRSYEIGLSALDRSRNQVAYPSFGVTMISANIITNSNGIAIIDELEGIVSKAGGIEAYCGGAANTDGDEDYLTNADELRVGTDCRVASDDNGNFIDTGITAGSSEDININLTLQRIGAESTFDTIADVLVGRLPSSTLFEVEITDTLASCGRGCTLTPMTVCSNSPTALCPVEYDRSRQVISLKNAGFTQIIWWAQDGAGNIFTGDADGMRDGDYSIANLAQNGAAFAQLFYVAPQVDIITPALVFLGNTTPDVTIDIAVSSVTDETTMIDASTIVLSFGEGDFEVLVTTTASGTARLKTTATFTFGDEMGFGDGELTIATLELIGFDLNINGDELDEIVTIQILKNDLRDGSSTSGIATLANPSATTDVEVEFGNPGSYFYVIGRDAVTVRERGVRATVEVSLQGDTALISNVSLAQLTTTGLHIVAKSVDEASISTSRWEVDIVNLSSGVSLASASTAKSGSGVFALDYPGDDQKVMVDEISDNEFGVRIIFIGETDESPKVNITVYIPILDSPFTDANADGVDDDYASVDNDTSVTPSDNDSLYAGGADVEEREQQTTPAVIIAGMGQSLELGIYASRQIFSEAEAYWSALIMDNGEIVREEIRQPPGYQESGIYDFRVRLQPQQLQARVAIPQRQEIPMNARYYKYIGDWDTFVEDDLNLIYTGGTALHDCPSPDLMAIDLMGNGNLMDATGTTVVWWLSSNGILRAKNSDDEPLFCVLLVIADNGDNDADKAVGVVEDPSAVGRQLRPGGGGAIDLWLLLLMLSLVLLFPSTFSPKER